jgi:hypothetical protein
VSSRQTLAVTWQRRREEVLGAPELDLDTGGLEASWTLSSVDLHPFSVSPTTGWRLRASALRESPVLGSELSLWKVVADARRYEPFGDNGVVALRLGGGGSATRPCAT